MSPVSFYVGPHPIFSYGIFILSGMILLLVLAAQLAREDGRKLEHTLPVGLGVLVGAIFGACHSHFIVEPGKFLQLLDFYRLFRPCTPGNILGLMLGG